MTKIFKTIFAVICVAIALGLQIIFNTHGYNYFVILAIVLLLLFNDRIRTIKYGDLTVEIQGKIDYLSRLSVSFLKAHLENSICVHYESDEKVDVTRVIRYQRFLDAMKTIDSFPDKVKIQLKEAIKIATHRLLEWQDRTLTDQLYLEGIRNIHQIKKIEVRMPEIVEASSLKFENRKQAIEIYKLIYDLWKDPLAISDFVKNVDQWMTC
jgi:hypothetical protein